MGVSNTTEEYEANAFNSVVVAGVSELGDGEIVVVARKSTCENSRGCGP
jgi:F420-0:gamma-glutamyl ligase